MRRHVGTEARLIDANHYPEYVLTDRGRSFATVLFTLSDWGRQHLVPPSKHCRLVEASTGRGVKNVFMTSDGRIVSLDHITLKPRAKKWPRTCDGA